MVLWDQAFNLQLPTQYECQVALEASELAVEIEYNLTDLPPSQNVAQGHLKVGSYAQIKTHVQPNQKMLGPVGIPYWGASHAKPWIHLCKVDTAWETTPETKHVWWNAQYTHQGHAHEDGILGLSQPTSARQQNSSSRNWIVLEKFQQAWIMLIS